MMNNAARYGFPFFRARLEHALAAGVFVAASSCCATGERVDAEKLTSLRPGQTRTFEIREALGPPKWESVSHGDSGCELYLGYGPENADYLVVVNTSDQLVRYERLIHTGCVEVNLDALLRVWNEPVPLVDERKITGLRVGASTHPQITALLGAARRADILDVGGYRIVWGPQEDDWVFEFYPDGILASEPEHRVRPEAKNGIGVR
jgi:hypothetical protein